MAEGGHTAFALVKSAIAAKSGMNEPTNWKTYRSRSWKG